MKLVILTNLIIFSLISSSAISAGIEVDKLPKINQIAQHHSNSIKYFAATDQGLFSSEEGLTWLRSFDSQMPVTMVSETGNGDLYAFVLGSGLVKFNPVKNNWNIINNQFGAQALLNLSSDATAPEKLIALNQFRKLIISSDSGKNWHSIKGAYQPNSTQQKSGQTLYQKFCQNCHGIDGVGETYNLQALTNKEYLRAPALDYSEHAWHHTDDQLVQTILEGSSRTPKMMAFGKMGVSEQNARDIVAYIKSLWTEREFGCQGPKHMQCMK